ncbi:MAG: hypothetical protein H0T46_28870 [Deltaproteobacteria bacterium]|nr:hypothetical protein [Deltaproteobacteria bacterium]
MPNLPFTLSLSLLAACTSAYALPSTQIAVDAKVLRAGGGPATLDTLLARYDAMAPGSERDELAAQIDQVAAQRYATISRLYWYTDLEAAKTAAQQTKKPILELRLLGRLDEELSCANSRIFRETLYANATVSKFLRENFVLLWTTERPVPKVTIDFGDGRTIRTTTTGNSAHFVRDSRGEVVDLLPGVYAPAPFRAELEQSLAMIEKLDAGDARKRRDQVRAYHAASAKETRAQWARIGSRQYSSLFAMLMKNKPDQSAVELAQMRTISKAYIEVPQLAMFGAEPGTLAEDETAAWAFAGQLAWDLGKHEKGEKPPTVLDTQSRTLVIALHQAGPIKASSDEIAALIPRFEQHLTADSALNEFKLRTKIHDHFAAHDAAKPIEFAALDKWLYADVFGTPITDRWLGLLPRTDVTGLPGDGATMP